MNLSTSRINFLKLVNEMYPSVFAKTELIIPSRFLLSSQYFIFYVREIEIDRAFHDHVLHKSSRLNKVFLITEMRTTEQGQVYFYHVATGVSSWHDPRVPRGVDSEVIGERLGPLPPGWEARHTPSGRIYYVDHNRRTTQFTHPALSQFLSHQNNPPANGTSTTETPPNRVPPTDQE